ncbi:MAG: PEGA domain-containing protein, partial [Methanocorpusculum sp.]|nr:PEGA domain-containing protein [Methanocorpusculum sp.]
VVVIVIAIIVGLVLRQYSGTLAISSSPSGASVYLGGEYKGITPLTIFGLSDGNYSLTLTKEGYNTYSTTVRVTSGKTTTENCALTRIAITGSLVITSSPSGASVYVDDVYQGLTPKTVYGLSAGNHVVCIEKFGYFSQLGNPYVTVGEETRYHARLL